MPLISLRQQTLYLTLCLAFLFTVLEPEPSRGLSFGWALVYWLAHIGCGLMLALVAAGWLSRRNACQIRPALLQLLLAGLLGSLAFAPLALVLEELFPLSPNVAAPDNWLDYWEKARGWRALVAEWLQLLPSYLCAWMLINAVPLVQLPDGRRTSGNYPQGSSPEIESSTGTSAIQQLHMEPDTRIDGASETVDSSSSTLLYERWLDQLPPAIGRRLLRIEADLHYLHVYTENGRAMLLGSLSVASDQLGEVGMRVHRSHWVVINQVKRVQRTGKGWQCELSDGSHIPISRRRVREVHVRLGRDFVAH